MMTLLFYKAPGKLFDQLIRFITGSKYSHCEILIDGMCYSADAWTNCVRALPLGSFNLNNWDQVDYPADPEWAKTFITSQLGMKYDWLGLIGFISPWYPQSHNRWYCSELCADALNIDERPISPGRLFELVAGREE